MVQHNFINQRLVEELSLPCSDTTNYGVIMGSGEAKKGKGICRGVCINLHGLSFTDDFLPFELGTLDLVLGMQWLHHQGPMTVDWKKLIMTFSVGGSIVTLKGDPTLQRLEVTLKTLTRTWQNEDIGFLIEFQQLETTTDQLAESLAALPFPRARDLERLLNNYEDVFHTPEQLPPPRVIDHRIELREGSEPVNSRPYRYPHAQKAEIEQLIQEMLTAGVIRPSTSPFASPIILVKKKDGSWRFCVDYRALNKATIPDKFPIPVIDELIDELHGARVFSRLDLKSGYHQIRVHHKDIHKTALKLMRDT